MDAEQCSEQEEHDPARRASRPGSSWSVGFAFLEPYYHQQDGPAGQFRASVMPSGDQLAATTRQKPCLCPSSRRSLTTKRYSGAAPTITSMRSAVSSLLSDPSRTSECHVTN